LGDLIKWNIIRFDQLFFASTPINSIFTILYRICSMKLPISRISAKFYSTRQHKLPSKTSLVANAEVFVSKYPGSRVVELAASHTGNYLKSSAIVKILDHVNSYEKNNAVSVVLFASQARDLFSSGLQTPIDPLALKNIYDLSTQIQSMGPSSVAVYDGQVYATPYSLFAPSSYRIASSKAEFSIPELLMKDNYPLGGVSYHLVRGSAHGLALARYLALTGKAVGVDTMHAMGLISHIVEDDPQTSICDALARTRPDSFESKIEQGELIDRQTLADILESMHVSSDIDITDEEIEDRAFLTPLQPLDIPWDNNSTDREIFSSSASIDYCFGADDSLSECEKRLQKFVNKDGSMNWASHAMQGLQSINAAKVESWFRLTRIAVASPSASASLTRILAAEVDELNKLKLA
jgi:enoyl-CoA hydratase/carnithine racemase